MKDKEKYEKNRTDKLVNLLNLNLDYLCHGDHTKYEPDVIYKDKKNMTIGIEVGTAYFGEYQAKQYWSILRNGWRGKKNIELLESFGPHPINREFDSIQFLINDKCNKPHGYKGVRNKWLLIWDDTLFTDQDDIIKIIDQLKIPKNTFQKIYIISYTSAKQDFELFKVK